MKYGAHGRADRRSTGQVLELQFRCADFEVSTLVTYGAPLRRRMSLVAESALPSTESFERQRHPLAATDTHGHQPDDLVFGPQGVQERRGDTGAGHSEWVTHRDGAAVHVELVPEGVCS